MVRQLTRNDKVVFIADTFVATLSSVTAILFVRFLVSAIPGFSRMLLGWTIVAAAASTLGIWITKTHRIIFTYSSFKDILAILAFAAIKALLMSIVPLIIHPFDIQRFPLLIIFDFAFSFTAMSCLKSLVFLQPKTIDEEEYDAGGLNVLIFGTAAESLSIVTRYTASRRYHTLGFITRDPSMKKKIIMDLPVWYIAPNDTKLPVSGVEAVLFSKDEDIAAESEKLIKYCTGNGICVLTVPPTQSSNYPGLMTNEIKHMLNTQFIPDGMNGIQRSIKRLFDLIFSAVVIVVLSPVMFAIALIIYVNDGEPVLYKQERIGRFGRPFQIYKFRTMRLDAEADGPALYSGDDDPRLTKVGKFLRRHHLDELPQLFNVFAGHMSFVGYRPERKVFIDKIVEKDPRYAYLYQIRPGVTSYATLRNGYTDSMEKMLRRLELDLFYLRSRSFKLDSKILFDTATNVLFGKIF